jgi:hypothetical protein
MAKKKPRTREKTPEKQPLRILVSSVVYGYEDLLESIYALLETFGYQVLMSHKGTIPVDPEVSAMESCLDSVESCDLFLGLILPRYGTGRESDDAISITHREAQQAIALNKPRWFLVHEHVVIARQLLAPNRDETLKPLFRLKPEITFRATPILSDLRVLDLFELAMRHDIADVAERRGNWVQPYGPEDDARLFATAQFRRYRELADKHLPKLKNHTEMTERLKGGRQ